MTTETNSTYYRYLASGMCGNCGQRPRRVIPDSGGHLGAYCEHCNATKLSRYHRRRDAGLCASCPSPAQPGKCRCQKCETRTNGDNN